MSLTTKRIAMLSGLMILAGGFIAIARNAEPQQPPVQISISYPETITKPIPLTVPVGSDFTVSLVSNPSTGYSWKLAALPKKSALTSSGHEFVPPPSTNPPVVGAPGKDVWKFTAAKKGNITLTFSYARPWEKGKAPIKTQVVNVVVK